MEMTPLERTLDVALYTLGMPLGERVYKEDVRLHAEVDDYLELHVGGLTEHQYEQRYWDDMPPKWRCLGFYRKAVVGHGTASYIVYTPEPYDHIRPVIDHLVQRRAITESLAIKHRDTVLVNLGIDSDTIYLHSSITGKTASASRVQGDPSDTELYIYRTVIDLLKEIR